MFVNAPLEEIVEVCRAGWPELAPAARRRGSFLLRRGRQAHRSADDQGAAGLRHGDVQDVSRFHTDFHLLDARSTVPGREGLRGGTGETFDWTLLAGRRSKVPLDPQWGPRSRERGRSGPTCAPLRGGHRQRHRERARTQGPRQAARVLRGCAASRLRNGRGRAAPRRWHVARHPKRVACRHAGVSAVPSHSAPRGVEHRFGRYGGQYVPETLMPALGRARAGVDAGARGPCLPSRAGRFAARLRGPSDPALPSAPPLRARRAAGIPQARGPQPHRLAQAQQRARARRCWPSAWASAASSPRPAPASTAWRPPPCARCWTWSA